MKRRIADLGDRAEHVLSNDKDNVGATPLHLSFLFTQYDLAKYLMDKFPKLILLKYEQSGDVESAYHGENVLHLAIVNNNFAMVQDVVERQPQVLHHRATGHFFSW